MISIAILCSACVGSSDVTDAELEATVVARVLATVVAIGGTPMEPSVETELPTLQPIEVQEDTFINSIFWEGTGNKRTSVFTVTDDIFSFEWDYDPLGVNLHEFTLQVIDADTHTPIVISLDKGSTILEGLGGFDRSGDFYLVIRSNGDWRIEVKVSK